MSDGPVTSTISTDHPGPGAAAADAAREAFTKADRYLCTGVFIDRAFRDMVIRKVHNDAAHRTAPSYGFDLVTVTCTAWRAWMLETAWQACLLAALVIAVILDQHAVVVAACGLGIAYLAWTAMRRAPKMFLLHARAVKERTLRQRGTADDRDDRREGSRLILLCCAGSVVLAVVAVLAARHGRASTQFTAAGVLLATIAAISAAAGAARQVTLNRIGRQGVRRPAARAGRLGSIAAQQACPYVVYRTSQADSGQNRPLAPDEDDEAHQFVGSGTLVHRWLPPLNVQLLRPGAGSMRDREYLVPPFKAHELVQYLKDEMHGAGLDPHRLQGFRIADRLYIKETEVPSDRSFLRDPCWPEKLDAIIDHADDPVHHYLEIQLSDGGKRVTTAFVRATVRGRSLSLDFAACALTPMPGSYEVLDKYREAGAGAVLRSTLREIPAIPASAGSIWRLAEVPWVLAGAARARKDRTLTPRRRTTIGTQLSIRQEKAAAWEDSQHDHIHISDDVKKIEQRLLKATEDFLDSRNVDTTVLKRLALNIISNGILNMGGRVDIQQAAVGPNAQFHNNNDTNGTGGEEPGGDQP